MAIFEMLKFGFDTHLWLLSLQYIGPSFAGTDNDEMRAASGSYALKVNIIFVVADFSFMPAN